jgi:hypothetical protein
VRHLTPAYAHFHTIGFELSRPRTEEFHGTASALASADQFTSLIVLSDDPTPPPGLGSSPRLYLGGTVYTEQGVRAYLPDLAHQLIDAYGPSLINLDNFWLGFRTGDVRYPLPRHVRLSRGELLLHDADVLSAVRWD